MHLANTLEARQSLIDRRFCLRIEYLLRMMTYDARHNQHGRNEGNQGEQGIYEGSTPLTFSYDGLRLFDRRRHDSHNR